MGKYGVPPRAEEIRVMIAERLQEAATANGEKISVEWRGQVRHLDVISMPVELLYFNPDTHRIRAQRSMDPARDRELDDRPWGKAGQDYLAQLLRCQPSEPDKTDPEFEALRDNLEDFGQKDPGIITFEGVLVNGNTRCAALRELGEKYIRVGVLPQSTTWDDISSVELSLQLRKEFRRDYSYINRLIAIDEQIRAGRRPEEIARSFHIQVRTLEQDRWVYSVILDAIKRSETDDGAALRLVDFERDQEKFRELHRAYVQADAVDKDSAEALKESRLAMIVLGYAKTDVRLAQPDFHSKYLDSKLPKSMKHDAESVAPVAIPGIPDLTVPDATTPVTKATRALTDQLLKAKATQGNRSAGSKEVGEASRTITEAKASFDRALEPAGRDYRLKQRKLAAPERLTDACDDIDLCIGDLAQARASRALDEDAFDDALIRLKETLAKLAKEVTRTFPDPGDGAAWLLNVTKSAND